MALSRKKALVPPCLGLVRTDRIALLRNGVSGQSDLKEQREETGLPYINKGQRLAGMLESDLAH